MPLLPSQVVQRAYLLYFRKYSSVVPVSAPPTVLLEVLAPPHSNLLDTSDSLQRTVHTWHIYMHNIHVPAHVRMYMCICSSVSDGTQFDEPVPRTARSEIRCPHDAQRPRGQDLLLVAKDEGFDRVPTKRRDELEWLTDIPHTPTDTSHLGLSAKEPHQMCRYLCGIAH